MSPPGMHTYYNGFEFKPERAVTKADFMRMMRRMGEEFGEGWEFEPEDISEYSRWNYCTI